MNGIMLLHLLTDLLTCDLRRLQSSLPYNQNTDLLTVSSAILLSEHSAKRNQEDKKIIDVGANLWKQLKRWFIFTLLQKDAH
ncbi:hypothetical protein HID58_092579 [Brassica napus]|uniref:Secreted protein n=1 Tax=Brassica napus TaxID=3708 RepID=A0ABQ7WXK8_BRANA|nr:hypothetical protein HID58_092579 [Brassica napus]